MNPKPYDFGFIRYSRYVKFSSYFPVNEFNTGAAVGLY